MGLPFSYIFWLNNIRLMKADWQCIKDSITYKWANLKNCTKLRHDLYKGVKIIAFPCTLIEGQIFFHLDYVTDLVIPCFKRTDFASSNNTHIVCKWHNQPISSDSLRRTDLIAVQRQFILTLAEKHLNWPPASILNINLYTAEKWLRIRLSGTFSTHFYYTI